MPCPQIAKTLISIAAVLAFAPSPVRAPEHVPSAERFRMDLLCRRPRRYSLPASRSNQLLELRTPRSRLASQDRHVRQSP